MTIARLKFNRIRDAAFSDSASPDEACLLPQRIEAVRRAMTATEVAAILAISPITIYKMAKAGRLPSLRIGRP